MSIEETDEHTAYIVMERRGTDDDTFRIGIDVRETEWRDPETGDFSRAGHSHPRADDAA